MYKVKMWCYDPGLNRPYEDEPSVNGPFETVSEAYCYALECANDECEYLNADCDDGISFGIVENENTDHIYVNYYYLESEYDTTGVTEIVTIYYVQEC